MTHRIHPVLSVVASMVVVISIVWGMTLVGSPGTARIHRFDQQRLRDLKTIFREVQSLCHDPNIRDELKRPLPETLDELAMLARSERISLADPETGQPYGFTVRDKTTYELCAAFSLELNSDVEVFWNHPSRQH